MFLKPFISAPVDILIMLVVAFLIGFLVAWMLRNMRINDISSEARKMRKDLGQLHKTNESLEIQLERAKDELESCRKKMEGLVSSDELQSAFSELKKEREKSMTARSSLVEIENAYEALKRELETRITQMITPEEATRLQAEVNRLRVFNSSLEDEIEQLKLENQKLIVSGEAHSPTQIEEHETSINDLNGVKMVEKDPAPLENGPSLISTFGIKTAHESERDDLKHINGVGPFIEAKLNKIGIYTFEQIASLTEEQVDQVTEAIEFFPGRIRRDDWIGQARRLMETS